MQFKGLIRQLLVISLSFIYAERKILHAGMLRSSEESSTALSLSKIKCNGTLVTSFCFIPSRFNMFVSSVAFFVHFLLWHDYVQMRLLIVKHYLTCNWKCIDK